MSNPDVILANQERALKQFDKSIRKNEQLGKKIASKDKYRNIRPEIVDTTLLDKYSKNFDSIIKNKEFKYLEEKESASLGFANDTAPDRQILTQDDLVASSKKIKPLTKAGSLTRGGFNGQIKLFTGIASRQMSLSTKLHADNISAMVKHHNASMTVLTDIKKEIIKQSNFRDTVQTEYYKKNLDTQNKILETLQDINKNIKIGFNIDDKGRKREDKVTESIMKKLFSGQGLMKTGKQAALKLGKTAIEQFIPGGQGMGVTMALGMLPMLTQFSPGMIAQMGLDSAKEAGMNKMFGVRRGTKINNFLNNPGEFIDAMMNAWAGSNNQWKKLFGTAFGSGQKRNYGIDISEFLNKDPKGRATFDGAAHTALTKVIPLELAKINKSLARGADRKKELELWNYDTNRFESVSSGKSALSKAYGGQVDKSLSKATERLLGKKYNDGSVYGGLFNEFRNSSLQNEPEMKYIKSILSDDHKRKVLASQLLLVMSHIADTNENAGMVFDMFNFDDLEYLAKIIYPNHYGSFSKEQLQGVQFLSKFMRLFKGMKSTTANEMWKMLLSEVDRFREERIKDIETASRSAFNTAAWYAHATSGNASEKEKTEAKFYSEHFQDKHGIWRNKTSKKRVDKDAILGGWKQSAHRRLYNDLADNLTPDAVKMAFSPEEAAREVRTKFNMLVAPAFATEFKGMKRHLTNLLKKASQEGSGIGWAKNHIRSLLVNIEKSGREIFGVDEDYSAMVTDEVEDNFYKNGGKFNPQREEKSMKEFLASSIDFHLKNNKKLRSGLQIGGVGAFGALTAKMAQSSGMLGPKSSILLGAMAAGSLAMSGKLGTMMDALGTDAGNEKMKDKNGNETDVTKRQAAMEAMYREFLPKTMAFGAGMKVGGWVKNNLRFGAILGPVVGMGTGLMLSALTPMFMKAVKWIGKGLKGIANWAGRKMGMEVGLGDLIRDKARQVMGLNKDSSQFSINDVHKQMGGTKDKKGNFFNTFTGNKPKTKEEKEEIPSGEASDEAQLAGLRFSSGAPVRKSACAILVAAKAAEVLTGIVTNPRDLVPIAENHLDKLGRGVTLTFFNEYAKSLNCSASGWQKGHTFSLKMSLGDNKVVVALNDQGKGHYVLYYKGDRDNFKMYEPNKKGQKTISRVAAKSLMKYYIIIKSPKASVEAAMKSVTDKAMDIGKGLVGAGMGAMAQGQFSTGNGGAGSYSGAKGGNTGLPPVLNVRLVGGRLDTLGIVGAIDAETYKSKLKMMNRENPGVDDNLNKESLFFNRDNIAKSMLKEQNVQEGREKANAEALQKIANGEAGGDGKDKKKKKDKKNLFENGIFAGIAGIIGGTILPKIAQYIMNPMSAVGDLGKLAGKGLQKLFPGFGGPTGLFSAIANPKKWLKNKMTSGLFGAAGYSFTERQHLLGMKPSEIKLYQKNKKALMDAAKKGKMPLDADDIVAKAMDATASGQNMAEDLTKKTAQKVAIGGAEEVVENVTEKITENTTKKVAGEAAEDMAKTASKAAEIAEGSSRLKQFAKGIKKIPFIGKHLAKFATKIDDIIQFAWKKITKKASKMVKKVALKTLGKKNFKFLAKTISAALPYINIAMPILFAAWDGWQAYKSAKEWFNIDNPTNWQKTACTLGGMINSLLEVGENPLGTWIFWINLTTGNMVPKVMAWALYEFLFKNWDKDGLAKQQEENVANGGSNKQDEQTTKIDSSSGGDIGSAEGNIGGSSKGDDWMASGGAWGGVYDAQNNIASKPGTGNKGGSGGDLSRGTAIKGKGAYISGALFVSQSSMQGSLGSSTLADDGCAVAVMKMISAYKGYDISDGELIKKARNFVMSAGGVSLNYFDSFGGQVTADKKTIMRSVKTPGAAIALLTRSGGNNHFVALLYKDSTTLLLGDPLGQEFQEISVNDQRIASYSSGAAIFGANIGSDYSIINRGGGSSGLFTGFGAKAKPLNFLSRKDRTMLTKSGSSNSSWRLENKSTAKVTTSEGGPMDPSTIASLGNSTGFRAARRQQIINEGGWYDGSKGGGKTLFGIDGKTNKYARNRYGINEGNVADMPFTTADKIWEDWWNAAKFSKAKNGATQFILMDISGHGPAYVAGEVKTALSKMGVDSSKVKGAKWKDELPIYDDSMYDAINSVPDAKQKELAKTINQVHWGKYGYGANRMKGNNNFIDTGQPGYGDGSKSFKYKGVTYGPDGPVGVGGTSVGNKGGSGSGLKATILKGQKGNFYNPNEGGAGTTLSGVPLGSKNFTDGFDINTGCAPAVMTMVYRYLRPELKNQSIGGKVQRLAKAFKGSSGYVRSEFFSAGAQGDDSIDISKDKRFDRMMKEDEMCAVILSNHHYYLMIRQTSKEFYLIDPNYDGKGNCGQPIRLAYPYTPIINGKDISTNAVVFIRFTKANLKDYASFSSDKWLQACSISNKTIDKISNATKQVATAAMTQSSSSDSSSSSSTSTTGGSTSTTTSEGWSGVRAGTWGGVFNSAGQQLFLHKDKFEWDTERTKTESTSTGGIVSSDTSGAGWVTVARDELSKHGNKKKNNSPKEDPMNTYQNFVFGTNYSGQPWCALFISYCIKKCHPTFKGSMSSLYPLHDGASEYTKLDAPKPGAILVWKRDGGGHTAICTEVTGDAVKFIGGNQGRAITESSVSVAGKMMRGGKEFLGAFWPNPSSSGNKDGSKNDPGIAEKQAGSVTKKRRSSNPTTKKTKLKEGDPQKALAEAIPSTANIDLSTKNDLQNLLASNMAREIYAKDKVKQQGFGKMSDGYKRSVYGIGNGLFKDAVTIETPADKSWQDKSVEQAAKKMQNSSNPLLKVLGLLGETAVQQRNLASQQLLATKEQTNVVQEVANTNKDIASSTEEVAKKPIPEPRVINNYAAPANEELANFDQFNATVKSWMPSFEF
jgi:hypothetical protein|nr:MAG TPA: TIGR02594 family protein [Caudoviricetes sp.]